MSYCDLNVDLLTFQSALGLQDLGSFYHTPIKDANGSVVLVTITTVRDPKSVSTAHCKWTSYAKAMKRIATNDCFAAPEVLLQTAEVGTPTSNNFQKHFQFFFNNFKNYFFQLLWFH